jgi:hypothetical protein
MKKRKNFFSNLFKTNSSSKFSSLVPLSYLLFPFCESLVNLFKIQIEPSSFLENLFPF